ncbi:MAG: transposase [Microcystis aeruginosa TA09]|nr:MAG: transposase [Microcystis aeruginosa TA09]
MSDRETVEQIRENPYLQYFIGLTNYQTPSPI